MSNPQTRRISVPVTPSLSRSSSIGASSPNLRRSQSLYVTVTRPTSAIGRRSKSPRRRASASPYPPETSHLAPAPPLQQHDSPHGSMAQPFNMPGGSSDTPLVDPVQVQADEEKKAFVSEITTRLGDNGVKIMDQLRTYWEAEANEKHQQKINEVHHAMDEAHNAQVANLRADIQALHEEIANMKDHGQAYYNQQMEQGRQERDEIEKKLADALAYQTSLSEDLAQAQSSLAESNLTRLELEQRIAASETQLASFARRMRILEKRPEQSARRAGKERAASYTDEREEDGYERDPEDVYDHEQPGHEPYAQEQSSGEEDGLPPAKEDVTMRVELNGQEPLLRKGEEGRRQSFSPGPTANIPSTFNTPPRTSGRGQRGLTPNRSPSFTPSASRPPRGLSFLPKRTARATLRASLPPPDDEERISAVYGASTHHLRFRVRQPEREERHQNTGRSRHDGQDSMTPRRPAPTATPHRPTPATTPRRHTSNVRVVLPEPISSASGYRSRSQSNQPDHRWSQERSLSPDNPPENDGEQASYRTERHRPASSRHEYARPEDTGVGLEEEPALSALENPLLDANANVVVENRRAKKAMTFKADGRSALRSRDIKISNSTHVDFLKLTRAVFLLAFNFRVDEDIFNHNSVDAAVVEAFETSDEVGPDPVTPTWDLNNTAMGSRWNKKVVLEVSEGMIEVQHAEAQFAHLPVMPRHYYIALVRNKYERLREMYKRGQPRSSFTRTENEHGQEMHEWHLENEDAVMQRYLAFKRKRQVLAAQRSRLHRKHRLREEAARIQVNAFDDDPDQRQMMVWASSVIQELGVDGMSSEEEEDTRYGKAFRVSEMVWRRDIDKVLEILDAVRLESDFYADSGGTRIRRIRANRVPSKRAAVVKLPAALYDPDWIQEAKRNDAYYKYELCPSRRHFSWYDIE